MKLNINPLSITPAASAPTSSVPFAATTPGIISNTIKGVLGNVPIQDNPWLKVAADIGQGIAREVGSVGLSAMNQALKVIAPTLVQSSIPVPHYLAPLFGDGTTLKDIPQRVQEQSDKIKANPFAQKLGLDQHAAPLAIGAVIGNVGLDLSGLGGEEKTAISALAKETDPALVAGMLRKIGLSESVAEHVAPAIAGVSRDKDVRNILDVAKSMHGLEILSSSGSSLEKNAIAETAGAPKTSEEAATRYYDEALAKPTKEGKAVVIGADDMKTHFGGDYDLANHPTYSKGANDLLMRAAEESPEKKVIFTAGGPASGKSEMIRGLKKDFKGVIYDSNLSNLDGARKQIEALKAIGKEPEIHMVLRDPETAYRFSKVREANGGHPITDNAFVRNHAAVPGIVRTLAEEGVPVKVIDTRGLSSKEDYANIGYSTDPLATLGNVGYTEDDIRGVITKYHEQNTAASIAKNEDGTLSRGSGEGGDQGQAHNDALGSDEVLRGEGAGKEASQIDQVPKEARTPALQIADIAGGKDGKSWESLIKGFSSSLPGEKKVHVLDYLATPEFVLEKIGLGKGAEMLQDAKEIYRKTLKKEIETIESWRKRVGKDPYTSTRIFRYLDGKAKDVYKEMTPADLEVAKEMKTYLDDWADRLKLPADNRLSNYITHIFENEPGADVKPSVFEEDPELAAIMQDKPAGSVYDPFLQRRTNAPHYKEDVWAALDAYVKRGSRKEAMDPALEYLKNEAQKLDGSSYKYIRNLTHRINMRPTEMDQLLDNLIRQTPVLNRLAKGPRPTMFLTQKIRQLFYRGTLGLNFGSALRNLSQGANTYAKLGEKYTVIGYTKLFARLLTGNLKDLKEAGILSDELVQDKKVGVYKSILQKADPVLFGMFELAEKINRGSAFYGARSKALGKGLSDVEATKYAQRIVRETQFAFGNVDSPVALSSDVIKTAAQLGTYNLKQIEFLGRMLKNKEFGGLARYTIASVAFIYTIGKMFNMTVGQLVPSVGLGGSPVGNLITGLGELMSSSDTTRADGKSKVERAIVSTIPGGAQIKKTVEGITAYNNGRDQTPSGKTRFKIPKGIGSFLQNAIFGKSATPEAQKYYDSLNKGSSKKSKSKLTI